MLLQRFETKHVAVVIPRRRLLVVLKTSLGEFLCCIMGVMSDMSDVCRANVDETQAIRIVDHGEQQKEVRFGELLQLPQLLPGWIFHP